MFDFQELKSALPISMAVKYLGLTTKEHNGKLRCACPACGEGGDRAIAINTESNVFYCFANRKGGDIIALVAHIKGIGQKQAAEELHTEFFGKDRPKTHAQGGDEGLQPLSHLDCEHEQVGLMFPPDVAKSVGVGYASKGMMKGLVAVPVRLPDGKLIGYIGVEDAKVPSTWKL